MKLSAKIVAALIVSICVVQLLHARSQIREATARYEADMREDALTLGRLFQPGIARAWRLKGKADAMYLIQYTNEILKADDIRTTMRIRWVWLDTDTDDAHRPRVPNAYLGPLLRDEEVSVFAPGPDGHQWLYSYVPVPVGIQGEPPGALEVSESTASLQQYAAATRERAFTGALVLVGVCAVIVAAIGAWFVGRPLRALALAAERIGRGELATRVDVRQRDEIGSLARTMNGMATNLAAAQDSLAEEVEARLRAVSQLRHADRLSSVGTLASGIAHELGTPLAVVSGRAKLIADGTVTGQEVGQYATSIARQADRIATIIRQLLDFARRREVTLAVVDLAVLLDQTRSLLRPLGAERGVEIAYEPPDAPVELAIDGVQIQQVFTNLILNAIDAMPTGGVVTVELGRERVAPPTEHGGEESEHAVCRIIDQGQGMTPAVIEKAFEPFFTTKPVGQGTGLGLAVSYGIVAEHGGWIDIVSEPGSGSCFSIYLPFARADAGPCSDR